MTDDEFELSLARLTPAAATADPVAAAYAAGRAAGRRGLNQWRLGTGAALAAAAAVVAVVRSPSRPTSPTPVAIVAGTLPLPDRAGSVLVEWPTDRLPPLPRRPTPRPGPGGPLF